MPRRVECDRCLRPVAVCYCAQVTTLPTRTRVLLLQHPREQRTAIGTARMAHLSLPNSVLRVGLDFTEDPVVAEAVAAGEATVDRPPAYVLFPKRGARDVAELPRDRPVTLVVLDGTWWQARKLLTLNPALAALPRVAFTPRRPSEYRIRRQPAAFCVSTIEALAEVLNVLEPAGGPFDRLLDPFRAMVAHQVRFATETRSCRHRRTTKRVPRRPSLAMRMAAEWERLVCIQGDANAWPSRHPERQRPETVHWVAHRPSTGEVYQAVIAPRCALAPSTPRHVDLPAARLGTGETADQWHRSWQQFLRPDDVLVQWGTYYSNLASSEGLALPARSLDLRVECSQMLRKRVATVEECLARMSASCAFLDSLGSEGRAGRRLAALVGVVGAVYNPHRVPKEP